MTVASQVVDVDALPWKPVATDVQGRFLWADETTGRRALLIRFAAGAALDRHVHDGDEIMYVLEGAVGDDHGTVETGQAGYRPPGCVHTVRSAAGATAVAFVTGGVSPVDADRSGGPPSLVIDVAAVAEQEVRPGVFQRPLWNDEAGGRRAMLVRYAPGATIARHRHVGDEFIYVLSGTVEDDFGIVSAGNVGFRPDGCTHTVTSPQGGTALAVLRGGVEPAAD